MFDITHLFHIAAPRAEVFAQLTSAEAIANWWTEDTVGEGSVGGELAFRFNGHLLCRVEVLESTSDEGICWKVIAGHDDWVGTEIHFALSDNEGKTRIYFAHRGFAQQDEHFAQCNFSWGRYMLSLRNLCEAGHGDPWPKQGPTA